MEPSSRQPTSSPPNYSEDEEIDIDIDELIEQELNGSMEPALGDQPNEQLLSFRDRLRETEALLSHSHDTDLNEFESNESVLNEYENNEENEEESEVSRDPLLALSNQSSLDGVEDEFMLADMFNEPNLMLSWNNIVNRRTATNQDDQSPLENSSFTLESVTAVVPRHITEPARPPNARHSPWNEQLEITAEDHYLHGVDIQGINFTTMPLSRAQYRQERNLKFQNYENLHYSSDSEKPFHVEPEKITGEYSSELYRFRHCRKMERCPVTHFQLRHLLGCTSKNDIFYPFDSCIKRWNPIERKSTVFADMSNIPNGGFNRSTFFRITSLSAKNNFVAVGGFFGELACFKADQTSENIGAFSTSESLGIVNYLEIEKSRSGADILAVSSNAETVRIISISSELHTELTISVPWAPNCARISPDKRILCVVGDSTETRLHDAARGDRIYKFNHHNDYSFSCAWSPCGMYLATGNQDKTCNIYDVRNFGAPVHTIAGKVGAIRSLQFSHDSKILCMAEPIDFLHLIDVGSDFKTCQVIDMFGDISGFCLTDDDDSLFIANGDQVYGGLLEFERDRSRPELYDFNIL